MSRPSNAIPLYYRNQVLAQIQPGMRVWTDQRIGDLPGYSFLEATVVRIDARYIYIEDIALDGSNVLNASIEAIIETGVKADEVYGSIGFLGDSSTIRKTKTKTGAELVNFDSVILPEDRKEAIKAAISQHEHHDKIFNEWGFAEVFEKGTAITLMFHGTPGTGKTLMAQAIANHVNQKLKIIQSGEIMSSEPGGAERTIKQYFKSANGKMVLLFDECDSLIADRNEVGMILAGIINTLLSELEKFEGIAIFTTNRLGKMDPALERRISAKIEFPFPSPEQRVQIWKRLIPSKAPLDTDVKFEHLAEHPLAGGNIKNVVLNAARYAAYNKMNTINHACFQQAIEKEIEGLKSFEAAFNTQPKIPRQRGSSMSMGAGNDLRIDSDMKQVIEEAYKHKRTERFTNEDKD